MLRIQDAQDHVSPPGAYPSARREGQQTVMRRGANAGTDKTNQGGH